MSEKIYKKKKYGAKERKRDEKELEEEPRGAQI